MAVLKKESNLQPVNGTNVHTILGPESTFEGKLSFEGTVRIDGKYKGEIVTTDTLIVGQSATVCKRKCMEAMRTGKYHQTSTLNRMAAIEFRNFKTRQIAELHQTLIRKPL